MTIQTWRTVGHARRDAVGLSVMILGLVLFLGVHTLTTQRKLRARLIASSGEGGYKVGYALVSLLGLVLIAAMSACSSGSGSASSGAILSASLCDRPSLHGVKIMAAGRHRAT